MDQLQITILSIVSSLAGAWGVVRHQTQSHADAIKDLKEAHEGSDAKLDEAKAALAEKTDRARAELERRIAVMDKEIAVLKSQADGADRRMTESLAAVRDTIKQMELQVIAHFDSALSQALQALRGVK